MKQAFTLIRNDELKYLLTKLKVRSNGIKINMIAQLIRHAHSCGPQDLPALDPSIWLESVLANTLMEGV